MGILGPAMKPEQTVTLDGLLLSHFEPAWAITGPSWRPPWAILGPPWAILGAIFGLLGPSGYPAHRAPGGKTWKWRAERSGPMELPPQHKSQRRGSCSNALPLRSCASLPDARKKLRSALQRWADAATSPDEAAPLTPHCQRAVDHCIQHL